jgi:1,4-dihydroxy-2-naphthoate octaprenyltransferase
MNGEEIIAVAKRIRPLHLVSGMLLYAMGVGISDYLGFNIDMQTYVLGQVWLLSLQLGVFFLGDYLGNPLDEGLINRPPFHPPQEKDPRKLRKEIILPLSAIFFSLCAAFSVILEWQHGLSISSAFLMVGFFTGYIVRIFPGFRLQDSGLGDIITTLQLVAFVPALGFTLQVEEYHRFLSLTTFPLFMLHLAMLLVFQLPTYAVDLARRKQSIMTKMGWKNGIFLHNLLVILSFLVLGISLFFGFPSRFVYPVFFALPFGMFQVWYLYKITQGAPTRWKLLTLTSVVLFLLPTYLFTYSFWTQ